MSNINDDGTAAWRVYGSSPVPHSYSPAWIAFSYVISLIGTLTTVELLHRQTSSRGHYNWFLMIGASIAMGGVAIWSMHFIGNQAINMGDGSQEMRLVYSSSYTAISFVLPILVVASSFLVFSLSHSLTWWNIVLGGILAGAAIVGMHYAGEAGISNYTTTFSAGTVAGACLIAVVAATVSLGLFFRLKSHWSSASWRRVLCAALLALAVSSMHWVAVVGTIYTARQHFQAENGVSTKTAGWICGVLALVCCLLLVIFMILWQHYIYRTRQKACEVTLAICVWDPDERLMMNAAGTIPSVRITRAYFDDVWEEEFQPGHPVFCWMFRVSRNWKSCVDLIPGMRSHIMHLKQAGALEIGSRDTQNHTRIFREQFCVAAADLALRLDQPLENIGTLYDCVITTGTSSKRGLAHLLSPLSSLTPPSPTASIRDVESVISRSTGRGQVLCLVKHATRQECARFQASGYAFGPVNNVIDSLARYGQVQVEELRPHLDNMVKYKACFQALEPGVHLAVFCVKPNMYQNFNVLVDKRADNLLPAIKLRSVKRIERWQQDIISSYSDMKAKQLMQLLPTQAADSGRPIQQRQFLAELVIAMSYLSKRIGAELFGETILTATAYQGPCANVLDSDGNMTQATIFAFRLVADLHSSQPPHAADEYIPFRLFSTQQRCYANSPDHANFASLVHQEFSGIEGRCSAGSISERRVSASSQRFGKSFKNHLGIGLKNLDTNHSTPTRKRSVGSDDRHDTASVKGLVRNPAPNPFGGILVSNQVSVLVTERDSASCGAASNDTGISMAPVANAVEVAASSKENDSFADELLVHALRDHVMQQRTNQHRSMAGVSKGENCRP